MPVLQVFCIVFHEQNFWKMKLNASIESFDFVLKSNETIWKIFFENV